MLVVIGIIVLIITLAIPSLRAISGSRSMDAGQNQVGAIIGRARDEAIGLQEPRGVLFYLDPATDRVNAAIVLQSIPPSGVISGVVYLDLVPDREYVVLPPGVGVQTLANSSYAGGARSSDSYIGLNPAPGSTQNVRYGGVILFDGSGRLISRPYYFRCDNTALQALLWVPATAPGAAYPNGTAQYSQYGFILFDRTAFLGKGYTDGDPGLDGAVVGGYGGHGATDASPPTEADEEAWLDQTSTPIFINRFNGTLIRGE